MTGVRARPRRPTWQILLLALLLAVVALLLGGLAGAPPASAHAVLESSTPSQGGRLGQAPPSVTLAFSEDVGISSRALQVLDPRGRRVDTSDAAHVGGDSRTLRVGLRPGLGTGSYTVVWRVVSADGHPASGTFAFGVGVPAGAAPPPVTVDPLVSAARAVAQLAAYAGAALVIGGSVFLFVLWRDGQSSARMRRVLVVGCAVAGVGSVATLFVQGPYVAGGGLAGAFDPGLLAETASSSYGRPLLLRVLAVALSVPVLGIWPRVADGEDGGPGGVAAAGNMVLIAASFALTGHAAEASWRLLAEVADAVHLVAASTWLGGLVVLFAAFLPDTRQARDGADVRAAVLPRWSRLAVACVGALVVTGSYQAWREVRVAAALPGTPYGRLVLGKLAAVLAVLVLALLARWAVAAGSPERLRSVVTVEATLGLVVLGVTSFLVATPPARVTFGPPVSASLQARNVEGSTLAVGVDVSPTRTGTQYLRLQVLGGDGFPLPFEKATGQLRAVDGGGGGSDGDSDGGSDGGPDDGPRLDIPFVADGVGVAAAQVVVPAAGRWTLTVHVVTDPTTDYAATMTYVVR